MIRNVARAALTVLTALSAIGVRAAATTELAKRLRPLQDGAITYTLTPQANNGGQWEVVQQLSTVTGASLIFAFGDRAPDSIQVFPREIKSDLLYELRSTDRGRLGTIRGDDLIDFGLEIHRAAESSAQVLVLEPIGIGPSRIK